MHNHKELLERCLKLIKTLPYSDAASDLFDDIQNHLSDDAIIISSHLTNEEALFEFLKHGDESHKEWLKSAINAFYNNKERPLELPKPTSSNANSNLLEENERLKDEVNELKQALFKERHAGDY